MIDAKELRIGNYISDGLFMFKVCEGFTSRLMYGQNINNANITYTLNFENIQPIPITEQWLLDFGFKNRGYEWSDKNICLESWGEGRCNEIYYSAGEGIRLSVRIEYIHQLQNLYFSLTNKELTLKPKKHESRID